MATTSIVDYLKSQGQASDYTSRAALAAKYGISGYTGSAQQNTQLLSALQTPAPSSPAPTVSSPAPAPTTQTSQQLFEQIKSGAIVPGKDPVANKTWTDLYQNGVATQAQRDAYQMWDAYNKSSQPAAPTSGAPAPVAGTSPTTQAAPATETSKRDYQKEAAVIAKLGYEPKTPEELALAAKMAYTSAQLSSMSQADRIALGLEKKKDPMLIHDPAQLRAQGFSEAQIQSLADSGDAANKAAGSQMAIGDPNVALGILQEALNIRNNVTDQPLGTSELSKAAGLQTTGVLGAATLPQELAMRGAEMAERINGFRKRVGEGAGGMKDLLAKYEVINEAYNKQVDRITAYNEKALDYERQLGLIDAQLAAKNKMDKASPNYVWNKDLQAFTATVDGEPVVKYIDPKASDAQGNLQVLEGDFEFADNCVKFARQFVPNLQYGLWDKEDKQKAVDHSITWPSVGDVVLTGEGPYGHAAYIEAIEGDEMILREANYRAGKVTSGRRLKISDSKVYGFVGPSTASKTPTASTVNIDPSVGADIQKAYENEGVNPAGAETFNNGKGLHETNGYGDLQTQFNSVNTFVAAKNVFGAENNIKIFNGYIEQGMYEEADKFLDSVAMSTLGAKGFDEIENHRTMRDQASKALNLIEDLQFGDFNYWNNLIQDNVKYAGASKDPRWVKIRAAIEAGQAPERVTLYGTAITGTEMKNAQDLFVTKDDDMISVINKLKNFIETTDESYRRVLDIKRGVDRDAVSGEIIGQKSTENVLGLDIP